MRVQKVVDLPFGRGKIGKRYPLRSAEETQTFAANLARHTVPLLRANTADCGDERRTLRLADGTTDPVVLGERIVPQLFGGVGLAAAKAAVAADAAYLRGCRSFFEAYTKTVARLQALGFEDGGHGACGASGSVESSVAQPLSPDHLYGAVALFTAVDDRSRALLDRNAETKRRQLEAGFYGNWKPAEHEAFLIDRFPHNFSYLAIDPDDHETHGHNASGIYVVTQDGMGFAKNGFIQATGSESLAVTLPIMRVLAHHLGENADERRRVELGFCDDTLHVGAGLVAEGIAVFAQAA